MTGGYFNLHFSTFSGSWWQRRAFFNAWRSLAKADPFWQPPYLPTLLGALNAGPKASLLPLHPLPVVLHGHRRKAVLETASTQENGMIGFRPIVESPVAAAVLLHDTRREDRAAYLALLHCANDRSVLERFLQELEEPLLASGCRRLIGPTSLSPLLGAGALTNYWNEPTPMHAPYNPPYLPDLLEACMDPINESTCFELPVPPHPTSVALPGEIVLQPLNAGRPDCIRMAPFLGDLPRLPGAPAPDADQAAFLESWLSPWPLYGWSAEGPVGTSGVLLLQPDFGEALRAGRGGWSTLGRLSVALARRRSAPRGRVLALSVREDWRGHGIGRALVQQSLLFARRQGWGTLSFGPLADGTPGQAFLMSLGATPRQQYKLFKRDLR